MSHTEPKFSAVKASDRRDGLSALRRESTSAHASRPLSCAEQTLPSFPCYLPVQTHARTGRRDNGGSLVWLGGDTMAICGVVEAFLKKKGAS